MLLALVLLFLALIVILHTGNCVDKFGHSIAPNLQTLAFSSQIQYRGSQL
jgi:hypothetical protein